MSAVGATTRIFRLRALPVDSPPDMPEQEEEIGYLDEAGIIYRLRWGESKAIGRADHEGRIYRQTTYAEREVGQAMPDGVVQSAGLFAGGEAGWVTENGIVSQGGMIFGETEVGRVVGPRMVEAGAALLLIFVPDEREAEHAARE